MSSASVSFKTGAVQRPDPLSSKEQPAAMSSMFVVTGVVQCLTVCQLRSNSCFVNKSLLDMLVVAGRQLRLEQQRLPPPVS